MRGKRFFGRCGFAAAPRRPGSALLRGLVGGFSRRPGRFRGLGASEFPGLDPVLHVAACAVHGVVQVPRRSGEVGDDVARVGPAGRMLGLDDDPPRPVPGSGGVVERAEQPLLAAAVLERLPRLGQQRRRQRVQPLVAGDPDDVIDPAGARTTTASASGRSRCPSVPTAGNSLCAFRLQPIASLPSRRRRMASASITWSTRA